MTINDELFSMVCAFVKTMSATCRSCLRPKTACDECDLRACRRLERSLAEAKLPINRRSRMLPPSFEERSEFYLELIRAAGHGLTSRQIDPGSHHCSRSLKNWTLRRMVELGMLKSVYGGKRKIYFDIPNKGKHT